MYNSNSIWNFWYSDTRGKLTFPHLSVLADQARQSESGHDPPAEETRTVGWFKNQFAISWSGKPCVPHVRTRVLYKQRRDIRFSRAIGSRSRSADALEPANRTYKRISPLEYNCARYRALSPSLSLVRARDSRRSRSRSPLPALGADIVQCSRGCNVWPRYVNGVMLWRPTDYSAD